MEEQEKRENSEKKSEESSEESEKSIENRKNKLKDKFFFWLKDPYHATFFVILTIAFIIRFWIFLRTMDQTIWWDAADYLSTAKIWGKGLNIESIWYHRRGPLWPFFAAVLFKIGLGEKTLRFTEVLFSTGIVATSYFLIKEMFNKKLALLTSICLTFSWIFLFFGGRPLTSIPATFFLLTATLFFWKGYVLNQNKKFIWLFGLFFALAALTRMQHLVFAPMFFVLIFSKEKFKFLKNKNLWIALGIIALFFIPHFVNYYMHYGNPVTDIMAHYFKIGGVSPTGAEVTVETIDLSTLFNFFKDLPYMLSKPIFILLVIGIIYFFTDLFLGIDKIFKSKNIQKKLFIFLWIVILFLVLGQITREYVEQRYVMPALPFLFAIACIPLIKLKNILIKHSKISKKLATIIIFTFLLVLLIYPTTNFLRNTKSNFAWANELIEAKKDSYSPVKQAGLWMKENSNPEDIVLSPSRPQNLYYSERTTIDLNSLSDLGNETIFNQRIDELRPKYLSFSQFEFYFDWMPSYPERHQDVLIPRVAFPSVQQPIVVVYEFDYTNWSLP